MIIIDIKRPVSSSKPHGTAATHRQLSGRVNWFNPKKGFGFITADNGDEYFVHYNAILMDGYRKLTTGQKVAFGLKPYGEYQQATEVKIIDDKPKQ